jgi:HK97 gp10 family phage protein
MGDLVAMKLHGMDDVLRVLDYVPERVERKVIATAVMAGAGPILESMRENAKKHAVTGLMAESIKARRTTRKHRGSALVVIGPTHMKRAFRRLKTGKLRGVGKKGVEKRKAAGERIIYRDPANYAHLVEGGHGGPHPAAPKPFMRPAFDARAGEAVGNIQRKLIDGVDLEIRKLARS